MYCKNCGVKLETNNCKVCPSCGEKLQDTVTVENKVSYSRGFIKNAEFCVINWLNFSGRISRGNYWKFILALFIFYFCIDIYNILIASIGNIIGVIGAGLGFIFYIVLGLATLSAQIRRLHDIGKSAWNILWAFVPLIGGLILLYFMLKGSDGPNKYGLAPTE